MRLGLRGSAIFFMAFSLVLGRGAWSCPDDAEPTHQLSLADLAAYRSALTGKATADDARASDPPVRASFKVLWNRPDAFRGRRVTVEGRVERIFRQGPVGSFPALAEIWIASPVGNPFCLAIPHEAGIPKLGQTVRFTGTFLKMVRYAAGDGARVAPLVVGGKPPVPVQETVKANGRGVHSGSSLKQWAGSPTSWLLGLALAALMAGVLAWQHLGRPARRGRRQGSRPGTTAFVGADPPLEFIEPQDEP